MGGLSQCGVEKRSAFHRASLRTDAQRRTIDVAMTLKYGQSQ